MLDVRKLRALRAIARCGSFSAAADELNYSQSAISQQVAQLERQVGTLLVERRGRSVRLTVAGHTLVDRTDRILHHLEEAAAELAAISGPARRPVGVVACGSPVVAWIPGTLMRFRSRSPDDAVTLWTSTRIGAALGMVLDGEADVAVLSHPGHEPSASLQVTALFDDPLRVVLPADHRLAGRAVLRLADLADEAWIVSGARGVGPDLHLFLTACSQAGFEPRIKQLVGDDIALQGFVAAGAGVGLVPDLVASMMIRSDVAIRPLAAAEASYPIVAVTAADVENDSPAGRLIADLREAARAQMRGGELHPLRGTVG
jgi:molybdate transport repressor ModE-like protein